MNERRQALARLVTAGLALLSAGLGGLVALVAAPRSLGRSRTWRRAATVFDLPPSGPLAVVLAEQKNDGWYRTRSQQVVFIDRDGDGYRALSAICSHLGCRVRFDAAKDQFICPCHGGVYSRDGRVVAGPPPEPLTRLTVRVNPKTSDLEVEL
jgi:Rieske Fe-S protein